MFKPGLAVVPTVTAPAPDAAATPGGVSVSFDRGVNRDRQLTAAVIVSNLEAAGGNNLEVSFNESDFFVIPPQRVVEFPVKIHRIRLRGSSGGTAAYSVMGVIA